MKNKTTVIPTENLAEAEIMAIKALYANNANERQQKLAFNAILQGICGMGNLSFAADDRTTSFNEGKRYCGIQLIKAVQCDVKKFKKTK